VDTLSNSLWAYMKDPEAFKRKLERRAEELFVTGYEVNPGNGLGMFLVATPTGQTYTVDALNETCTCPFQKSEVPLPCKHLQGLENLVVQMLDDLQAKAQLGYPGKAAGRMQQYHALETHWRETIGEVMQRQAEADAEGRDAQLLLHSDRDDREVREAGYVA